MSIVYSINQPLMGMLQPFPSINTVGLPKGEFMEIGNKTVDIAETLNANIERGYITGFFDAEGMVRIEDKGTLRITIIQSFKPVLEYIKGIFKDGSLEPHSKEGHDKRGIHHKGAWRYRIASYESIPFLKYVSKHSVEKREQINIAIQYQEEIKATRNRSDRCIKLTSEEIEQRNLYINELKRLKHRTDSIYYVPDMPKDIKIGYLAGFFDGEGCVYIDKGKKDSYTLKVAITNSNADILNLYNEKFSGKIREHSNNTTKKEYHKTMWIWEISNDEALSFIKEIYPYTKVKKNEIKLAIEFQEWHNDIRVIRTPEHKAKAEWYYTSLRELKKCTDENIPESCNCYTEPISTEEDIIKSSMTLEKARLIRNYHIMNQAATYNDMSKIFGLDISTIGRVLNNETWEDENAPPAPNKIRKVRKHSSEEATKIRDDYITSNCNISFNDLAKKYDTTPTTICNIINNKVLKDNNYTPPEIEVRGENNSQAKLTQKSVNEMRDRCKNNPNLKYADLSKEYNISASAVSAIIRNERWVDNNYIPPEKVRKNKSCIIKDVDIIDANEQQKEMN